MSHARTQIRNAVVTLLTGLTTTDDRVFTSRVHPLSEQELPALLVFVDEESIERQTIHAPALLSRSVAIRVECVSALASGLDDDLDQMALEVEHAIAGNPTLTGIFNGDMIPLGIEVDRSGDGAVHVGRLTVVFQAVYEVMSNAVDTAV